MALVTPSQTAAALLSTSLSPLTTSTTPTTTTTTEVLGEEVTDAKVESLGERWGEGDKVQPREEGDGVNWVATMVSITTHHGFLAA